MSTVATRKKTLAASPKRAAILKSAIAEFVEHGFERTSVEQIAAAAGVALQTVYAHFGSKTGLVEAIERECLKRPADLGDFRYRSTASLDEQLRSMASAVVRVYMSGPYVILMRIRMSLWIDAPDRSTFSLSEAKARFNAPIVEWIAAAVRDGRLVCQDPHQAAAQFSTLLTSALWPVLAGGDPMSSREQDQLIRASVEMFLRRYESQDSDALLGQRPAAVGGVGTVPTFEDRAGSMREVLDK